MNIVHLEFRWKSYDRTLMHLVNFQSEVVTKKVLK